MATISKIKPTKKKALSLDVDGPLCPKCGSPIVERQASEKLTVFSCGFSVRDCGCEVAQCSN
jgi:ribosomal protein L37AE/L43A